LIIVGEECEHLAGKKCSSCHLQMRGIRHVAVVTG
jgi:hypothetical protein